MDVVLPEGPSEGVSGDNEGDGTAAETRDNLGIQQTQEGRESEVQESREHGESDELKPGSERIASHQGKGKQASNRKPRARTKGLVKKLQEQVS